jgi:hypothetical protein
MCVATVKVRGASTWQVRGKVQDATPDGISW